MWALTVLSRALFSLGYPDQAREKMDQAFVLARQLSNPYTIAMALWASLFIEFEVESARTGLQHAEEVIALKFPLFSAPGAIFRGWYLSVLEHESDGSAILAEALAAYRASGSLLFAPFFLLLLADALARVGHRTAALERLAEAMDIVEETQERSCEAELHRAKGELLNAVAKSDEAEACFVRALGYLESAHKMPHGVCLVKAPAHHRQATSDRG
jgi:predicted ATPase